MVKRLSPNSEQHRISPYLIKRVGEENGGDDHKCRDVQTNSPNLCHKNCVEKSEANMDFDSGA